MQLVGGWK